MINFSVCAQQDCSSAISVCTNSFVQNSAFSGVGSSQEIPNGSSCLSNGEVNSVWYRFSVASGGSLEFQLNPLNPNDDYDFALYELTNDSCAGISSGLNQAVSCNYSADQGSTGLSAGGTGNNNGSSGPNQNAPLTVQSGQSYTLLVSNFTSSQTGYSLDFGGSASIVDTYAGSLDSVSLGGVCNPISIRLYLDEPINCSSISTNASEFAVSGPSTVTPVFASAYGCSGGKTTTIRIDFQNKISVIGTYTLTIGTGSDGDTFTDECGNELAAGNTVTFTVDDIGPDASVTNLVDASCGQSNGSAQVTAVNGTQPYTYSWTNTSPPQSTSQVNNLASGSTYYCYVTDANGCSDRASAAISNNTPFTITVQNVVAATCNGMSDGTAELSVSGGSPPFSYSWPNGATGPMATNLSGGNITVQVEDQSGCSENVTVNIPQPAPINLPVSIVNPDCGQANGSATVSPTGGNGGWVFSWNTNPNQTTATATGLSAAVYNVTATDQNGCSENTSVILVDNFAPNATIESRVPDCGQGLGEATALATSGVAPYSYVWNTNPPQSTATATGLSEGYYFVTITDANSCVQIINVKIDSVTPPSLSVALTPPDCGQDNGEAIATTINGIAPFVYAWSSSSNATDTETNMIDGNYSVVVTDSVGCTDSLSFDLNQLPPESSFSFEDACIGDEISFTPESTSGATTWSWSFGDGMSSDLENPTYLYDSPGQYEVTVIFSGGCMNDTVVQLVNVFELPNAEFGVEPEFPTTRVAGQFVDAGGGDNSFYWEFGDGASSTENDPSHLYELDGMYDVSLIVIDQNGCTDTSYQTIEVLLQPVIYFPNAFNPNGIGENSRFKGYGIGVTDAELTIFDRWGTVLFFSAGLNDILYSGWDGTYKGTEVGQGVYAYKLKASFYNDSSFEKIGTVTLLR